MSGEARKRVADSIDAIEESYEFFLAYAAQGITKNDPASPIMARLRRYLDRTASALSDLPAALGELLDSGEVEGVEEVVAFRSLVNEDASRAEAVVALVRSRAAISSQLVDNLNASVHIRKLLTDLFLLDEVLKLGVDLATEPQLEPAP